MGEKKDIKRMLESHLFCIISLSLVFEATLAAQWHREYDILMHIFIIATVMLIFIVCNIF